MLRLLSSPCILAAINGLFKSRGRMVFKLIVPPTDPSIVLASGTLVTSTPAIIEAFTSSKSIPVRPDPDPNVDTPLISVRLSSVPRI